MSKAEYSIDKTNLSNLAFHNIIRVTYSDQGAFSHRLLIAVK